MKLVLATNNKNKLKEIEAILKGKFDGFVTLKDLNLDVEVEETGSTFFENALLKAKEISNLTGLPALSDDSGLCVDALGGAPGVYSARYAGEEHDDNKNIDKLLDTLKDTTDRTAHFQTVVVLFYPDGKTVSAQGSADGTILTEKRGENGFGYDPVFYSTELKKTFAEASSEEKNAVSHRSRALKNLLSELKK